MRERSAEPIAFVAGATGYTGREVVRQLRERGATVVAHVRPDSARLKAWQIRFQAQGAQVDSTPWDADAMAATLARLAPTHVFALLGTTRKRGREARRKGVEESYETVDYGLSSLLLAACRDLTPRPRFVYLSAVGVGPRSRGGYMRARYRLERELVASGVPYTIVRPSFISGDDRDEDRPLERVAARAADSFLQAASALGARKLQARYRSMTNIELGEAIVAAALDAQWENRVLEPGSMV